jgi:hypothetical protein
MSSLFEVTPGDQAVNRLVQLGADFIALLGDKAATKRLSDLAAAQKAVEAKIAEAKAATKDANEEIKRIKAELAAHDDAMLRARQAHEKEVVTFERTRGALLDEATKLRDQARADADQAAMKLKELNSKLAAIQSAAAA